MELYGVLPECRQFVEPLADIRLITRGSSTIDDTFHLFSGFPGRATLPTTTFILRTTLDERFQELLGGHRLPLVGSERSRMLYSIAGTSVLLECRELYPVELCRFEARLRCCVR